MAVESKGLNPNSSDRDIKLAVQFWIACLPFGFGDGLAIKLRNVIGMQMANKKTFTWTINSMALFNINNVSLAPGKDWPQSGSIEGNPEMQFRFDQTTQSYSIHIKIDRKSISSKSRAERVKEEWGIGTDLSSFFSGNSRKETATDFEFINDYTVNRLIGLKEKLGTPEGLEDKNGKKSFPKDWPRYDEFSAMGNVILSKDQYNEILKVARQLEKETNSIWYPNKDRKRIKIDALRSLIINTYREPDMSVVEHVMLIEEKYPQATKGTVSHRVADLFEMLKTPTLANTVDI